MKIQTSSLRGAALDWAVAKCEGVVNGDDLDVGFILEGGYSPSTNWAQGGPIIEREQIDLKFYGDGVRTLQMSQDGEAVIEQWSRSPLVAAMVGYVMSKFGDEIEIPDELIKTKEAA